MESAWPTQLPSACVTPSCAAREGTPKRGGGLDSIVFAAGDVILNQWRVTRDGGLSREHVCTCTLKALEDGARGGGRGAEDNREKEEKKIGLN